MYQMVQEEASLEKYRVPATIDLATEEDIYKNIPWKDFEKVHITTFHRGYDKSILITLRLKTPLNYHTNTTYVSAPSLGVTAARTYDVNRFGFIINRNRLTEFEKMCDILKEIETGVKKPVSNVKKLLVSDRLATLPNISICSTIPPPTQHNVSLAIRINDRESHPDSLVRVLLVYAGIDWKKTAGRNLRFIPSEYKPAFNAYWEKYCYNFLPNIGETNSFTTNNHLLVSGYGGNIPIVGTLLECGAELNFLDFTNGSSILDVMEDFGKSNTPSMERTFTKLRANGVKFSREIVEEYRTNADAYNKLKAVIKCNSIGEGFLANLGNRPEEYFLRVYNIGVRKFDDAVSFYETTYKKKLTNPEKNKLKGEYYEWD